MHLTGLQALVRVALDQVRRDREEGRRVAVLVSGYPGSPLAGFDQELGRARSLLEEHDVRLVPGLNEELAASTVGGTQLLEHFPHSRYDGVVGMWYGKAPGLDRSLDAIRHCNFTGTARYGGVLAVVGDDPSCKSSSLPSHSEHAFAHAFVPILSPANATEVLQLGLHGIALSRYAGLWVGLRVVADVADGGGVLDLGEPRPPEIPKLDLGGRPFRPRVDPRLLPPHVNRIEEEIVLERLEAVRAYAAANDLNRLLGGGPGDRVGIAASGALFAELVEALDRLGLDERLRESLGLRLLKLGLVYPIETRVVRDFASGLEQIIVVDDRRGFLEEGIRSALPGGLESPLVVGQLTDGGEPWLAATGDLTADTIAVEIGSHLARHLGRTDLEERVRRIREAGVPPREAVTLVRRPHFCSGCPHSVSTRVPEGSVVGGGIGCHTMALLMERGIQYVGAMGSEGAHWIGLSRYVDTPHVFQNLGDGTYAHSGRLAVRAAVAAGARMTFKILYNGRIAMTGGQEVVGGKSVTDLVADLLADGVQRVIAVSGDADLLARAKRDPRLECAPREGYDAAMRALAREEGVTALVFDEFCANERQRLERRGLLERPTERVMIHEDVCEGCGDCGVRSECLSLRPVRTPLGRKTRIHLTSCSDDRSCLDGECPSFLSIDGPPRPATRAESRIPDALPDPPSPPLGDEPYRILLVGIGSTGVVTVNALLVRAAEIEGLYARHLDQTGLSQRGGQVVSHCVLGRRGAEGTPRIGWEQADALLAFDPLGAADATVLGAVSRARTRAVVQDALAPTAEMVSGVEVEIPEVEELCARIALRTRELRIVPAEALAEAVLGSSLAANVVQLGYACQAGVLPLRPESLEEAIHDRGLAVEENLAAFRLGRAVADDPSRADGILRDETPPTVAAPRSLADAAVLGPAWRELEEALGPSGKHPAPRALLERIAGLALDLTDYQSRAYARRYLKRLVRLARAEREFEPSAIEITRTASVELYRLMAYKDEYEVARLLLRGPFRRWLDSRAGGAPSLRYHLHPPLLRALGLEQKISVGRWVEPLLAALCTLRRLRGTPLDPFGWTQVRRAERGLVVWYERLLESVAVELRKENRAVVLELVSAPEAIRGYEALKLRRAAEARGRVERLLAELREGSGDRRPPDGGPEQPRDEGLPTEPRPANGEGSGRLSSS